MIFVGRFFLWCVCCVAIMCWLQWVELKLVPFFPCGKIGESLDVPRVTWNLVSRKDGWNDHSETAWKPAVQWCDVKDSPTWTPTPRAVRHEHWCVENVNFLKGWMTWTPKKTSKNYIPFERDSGKNRSKEWTMPLSIPWAQEYKHLRFFCWGPKTNSPCIRIC